MTETMEWERCTNSHTVAYWLNMREDLVGNDGHAPDLPQRETAICLRIGPACWRCKTAHGNPRRSHCGNLGTQCTAMKSRSTSVNQSVRPTLKRASLLVLIHVQVEHWPLDLCSAPEGASILRL